MTLTEYTAYFESLATQYKPIGHSPEIPKFGRIDIEEVVLGLRSRLDFSSPVMILENFEGALGNNEGSNLPHTQAGAFYILQNAIPDDLADEVVKLDNCHKIGIEILARLYRDTLNSRQRRFEIEKTNYHKVGPIWDNAYGYRFEVTFFDQYKIAINPANWSEPAN